ncbi:hypothetical protein [Fodinicola feengrottensis]|uniref:hypothetical protein n=1 Tax=Fodinicola feengrottensis TaxID=435914 RepID=UPI0024413678|nr:hypothetical protein [Fodinicola feengrottensis]
MSGPSASSRPTAQRAADSPLLAAGCPAGTGRGADRSAHARVSATGVRPVGRIDSGRAFGPAGQRRGYDQPPTRPRCATEPGGRRRRWTGAGALGGSPDLPLSVSRAADGVGSVAGPKSFSEIAAAAVQRAAADESGDPAFDNAALDSAALDSAALDSATDEGAQHPPEVGAPPALPVAPTLNSSQLSDPAPARDLAPMPVQRVPAAGSDPLVTRPPADRPTVGATESTMSTVDSGPTLSYASGSARTTPSGPDPLAGLPELPVVQLAADGSYRPATSSSTAATSATQTLGSTGTSGTGGIDLATSTDLTASTDFSADSGAASSGSSDLPLAAGELTSSPSGGPSGAGARSLMENLPVVQLVGDRSPIPVLPTAATTAGAGATGPVAVPATNSWSASAPPTVVSRAISSTVPTPPATPSAASNGARQATNRQEGLPNAAPVQRSATFDLPTAPIAGPADTISAPSGPFGGTASPAQAPASTAVQRASGLPELTLPPVAQLASAGSDGGAATGAGTPGRRPAGAQPLVLPPTPRSS